MAKAAAAKAPGAAIPVTIDKPAKKKGYDEYELEDAVRTLCRAHEIMGDRKMMKALTPMLEKKKKAITSIDDLRRRADEMSGEEGCEE